MTDHLTITNKDQLESSTSRREFLSFMGSAIGGLYLASYKPGKVEKLARALCEMDDVEGQIGQDERTLAATGYIPDVPLYYVFDENKYSPLKRELSPSEWAATNRHLPIKIDPHVINKPGERSPEALMRVVAYTSLDSPRYVAEPGERVSMCNIAAWDWSRALQVHLPHWMGETELSANMLFRWISHPEAGGIRGEGWQPVSAIVAQLLANLGIPVFALAQNPDPNRPGHVALVYPKEPMVRSWSGNVEPFFASVSNGRWRGSNGIKGLNSTFRRLNPTYFVHKVDFIVFQDTNSDDDPYKFLPFKYPFC